MQYIELKFQYEEFIKFLFVVVDGSIYVFEVVKVEYVVVVVVFEVKEKEY